MLSLVSILRLVGATRLIFPKCTLYFSISIYYLLGSCLNPYLMPGSVEKKEPSGNQTRLRHFTHLNHYATERTLLICQSIVCKSR